MSDQQALLAAIRENPDDDTPRVAYADWLDENATTKAERTHAEFIRLQCELARDGVHSLTRRDAIRDPTIRYASDVRLARAAELLMDNGILWLIPDEESEKWGVWLNVHPIPVEVIDPWKWVGGFVWSIECPAEDWFRTAKVLRKTQPLREMRFADHLEVRRHPGDADHAECAYFTTLAWVQVPEGMSDDDALTSYLLQRYWPEIHFPGLS